jgi:hypothetical protein
MSVEQLNDAEEAETAKKPTITIAEKEGDDASALLEKPTITIAEKDGGN